MHNNAIDLLSMLRVKVLNSKRLRIIAQMVSDDYFDVWDCCCDHGLLGIELLAQTSATLHFVDCEKHLIDNLEAELISQPQYVGRWNLYSSRVETLHLTGTERQLLIIAGVGGDTCIKMVEALLAQHPGLELDFILCPVRQVEQLRLALANYDLGLLQECLVDERDRFYEVLHLRRFDSSGIPQIMQALSPSENPMHKHYVENRVAYLSKVLGAVCLDALSIYKALLESPCRSQ